MLDLSHPGHEEVAKKLVRVLLCCVAPHKQAALCGERLGVLVATTHNECERLLTGTHLGLTKQLAHASRTDTSCVACIMLVHAQVSLASGASGSSRDKDKSDDNALPNWWNLRMRGVCIVSLLMLLGVVGG